MENGIHVLIEKPVTSSVDEAEKLLNLAVKKMLSFRLGTSKDSTVLCSMSGNLSTNLFHPDTQDGTLLTKDQPDVGVVLGLMIHGRQSHSSL